MFEEERLYAAQALRLTRESNEVLGRIDMATSDIEAASLKYIRGEEKLRTLKKKIQRLEIRIAKVKGGATMTTTDSGSAI